MTPWPQKACDIVDSDRDSRASIVTGLFEVATSAYLVGLFPRVTDQWRGGWLG